MALLSTVYCSSSLSYFTCGYMVCSDNKSCTQAEAGGWALLTSRVTEVSGRQLNLRPPKRLTACLFSEAPYLRVTGTREGKEEQVLLVVFFFLFTWFFYVWSCVAVLNILFPLFVHLWDEKRKLKPCSWAAKMMFKAWFQSKYFLRMFYCALGECTVPFQGGESACWLAIQWKVVLDCEMVKDRLSWLIFCFLFSFFNPLTSSCFSVVDPRCSRRCWSNTEAPAISTVQCVRRKCLLALRNVDGPVSSRDALWDKNPLNC